MGSFLLRRLAFTLVVLLGSLVVAFLLSHAIPGDPARAALGEYATEEAVTRYRQELGLDRPLIIQLARYLGRVIRGDLGTSINTARPVLRDLTALLPATLELILPSLFLATLLGIVFGVTSAVHAGNVRDHISRVVSAFGVSMPIFWFGIVLQVTFYRNLGWLPAAGRLPAGFPPPQGPTGFYTIDSLLLGEWATFVLAVQHLILPVVTLTMFNLPFVARMTRAMMLDVLRSDYVRTAWSKGLPSRVVVYKHALRNSLIPVVTVLGMRIGAALGGAVITETVFSWPGMGRYAVHSLRILDYPVVIGFTLMMTFGYALSNLLVDLSYALIDPRVRFDS